jgi:hypothetical protein
MHVSSYMQTNFDVGVDVEAAASAAQSTNNARRLSTLPKEYLLTHPCMDPRVLPAKVGDSLYVCVVLYVWCS